MNGRMYNYYNKQLKNRSRALRKNMTEAERLLWYLLLRKRKMLGYTFNRQRPVMKYIVDFMCKELKLIIEVDGGYHEIDSVVKKDKKREDTLKECGFKVIRFSNDDVLKNISHVRIEIEKVIKLIKLSK